MDEYLDKRRRQSEDSLQIGDCSTPKGAADAIGTLAAEGGAEKPPEVADGLPNVSRHFSEVGRPVCSGCPVCH